MKNSEINDGKDVITTETEEIYTLSGKYKAITNITNNGIPVTRFEPKRNNRWVLNFEGNFENIPPWAVKKTHRPKLINGSWSNIKIVFYDSICQSTTNAIVEGFRASWQLNNRISKIPIIHYKLQMLDPTGVAIEEWDIKGGIIEADFGKLDFAKPKLSEIKLIIKPSSVILVY